MSAACPIGGTLPSGSVGLDLEECGSAPTDPEDIDVKPFFHRSTQRIRLLILLFVAHGSLATAAQIDINGPPGSVSFGRTVTALPNGNIVITDPNGPVSQIGAVYLYSPNGALISTLTGSSMGDQVGVGGITVLSSGHFVVNSYLWNTVGTGQVGAVTWVNGNTGLSGVVSSSNSLVGSSPGDAVGFSGVVALANGHYVVASRTWDNSPEAATDAGAITWGNGFGGVSGEVSIANSLVGMKSGDDIGSVDGAIALANGNFVVASPSWDKSIIDAGAVTWRDGTVPTSGAITEFNSLTGHTQSDGIGNVVTKLANGNFVVSSFGFDHGGMIDVGAVTWVNGSTGMNGEVAASNSLLGANENDIIGAGGVTALSNGHYVVCSPYWDNGLAGNAGAVTWANGTVPTAATVTPSNSLVGTGIDDQVGIRGATALVGNGHYVVNSSRWNGGISAVTWRNGDGNASGAVSGANSLIASFPSVGSDGVIALANGNYVVGSPYWTDGVSTELGAATWGSGLTGISGLISAANSLIGANEFDSVGAGVTALANGHYVVRSPGWDNGSIVNVGAVTWGNGSIGRSGVVTTANSLIGTQMHDGVGSRSGAVLANGGYVVVSPGWDDGMVAAVGALTWVNGNSAFTGVVARSNSLIGGSVGDGIGQNNAFALPNGDYLAHSQFWSNIGHPNAGALTVAHGGGATNGVVDPSNSVLGTVDGTGSSFRYTFDAAGNRVVVARPPNIVTLFTLPPHAVFANSFE